MTVSSIFRNLSKLHEIPKFMRAFLFRRIIVVFQMGKVGSMSALETIKKPLKESGDIGSRYLLLHMHQIFAVRGFYRPLVVWRARLGLPLLVVCPIREPIARNVSALFNVYAWTLPNPPTNADLEEIEALFMADTKSDYDVGGHQFALNWFDKHFKPLTRIDVYKKPFSTDRKWQVYKRGFTRVLLYRTDLKRSEQAKLISHFLGIKLDEMTIANVTKNKEHAERHSRFRESVKLSERYIRRMHDSRFAQHFWSPEELKAAADKWRDASDS